MPVSPLIRADICISRDDLDSEAYRMIYDVAYAKNSLADAKGYYHLYGIGKDKICSNKDGWSRVLEVLYNRKHSKRARSSIFDLGNYDKAMRVIYNRIK